MRRRNPQDEGVNMNKKRIEQIAQECGLWPTLEAHNVDEQGKADAITLALQHEIIKFAQAIRNEALEDACKAVYGNAESDNVAQRTVDAIRKMKV